jgi:hypothetical protein
VTVADTCNSISSTEYKIRAESDREEVEDANVKLVVGRNTGLPQSFETR